MNSLGRLLTFVNGQREGERSSGRGGTRQNDHETKQR
jgi:hypothetical protein